MSCSSRFTLTITITYSYWWTISLLSTRISKRLNCSTVFCVFLIITSSFISMASQLSSSLKCSAPPRASAYFYSSNYRKKVDADIYQNISAYKHHPLSWTWEFMPASLVFPCRVWLIWLMPDFNKISRSLLELWLVGKTSKHAAEFLFYAHIITCLWWQDIATHSRPFHSIS